MVFSLRFLAPSFDLFVFLVVFVVHLRAFPNLSNDFPARFVDFDVRAVKSFVGSFLQPSQGFAELVTDEFRLFFTFLTDECFNRDKIREFHV